MTIKRLHGRPELVSIGIKDEVCMALPPRTIIEIKINNKKFIDKLEVVDNDRFINEKAIKSLF